ncbi:MAG: OmpA family protein [Granulosicoccaceae bacterium]
MKNSRTNNLTAITRVVGLFLLVMCSSVWSLDNQWYFGIGGGVSILEPNPDEPGLNVDNNQGTLVSLFLGRDIDERTSVQLQAFGIGEAELTNGQTVGYTAVDASVLYRFYDTRDRQLRPGSLGTALFGRFGLGFADRDTTVPVGNNQDIYFGAGGGAEFFLTQNIAVRVEAYYHDQDIVTAQLSLLTRFGGRRTQTRRPPDIPAPEVQGPELSSPALPKPASPAAQLPVPALPSPGVIEEPLPAVDEPVPQLNNDSDSDGVLNAADACPSSTIGYPVGKSGCPLFDGVLSGVQFIDGTSELAENASVQLDYLANLLKRYPIARIELLAHTDSQGDVRSQSILTRARLRTVGTYMIGQGIRANRLVLRSFGGTRPIYDNATSRGRLANNRFEVIEHLPPQ